MPAVDNFGVLSSTSLAPWHWLKCFAIQAVLDLLSLRFFPLGQAGLRSMETRIGTKPCCE